METKPQNESPPKPPAKKPLLLGILIFVLAFAATFSCIVSVVGFESYPREMSRRAACKCRLKGLGTALELYAQAESNFPVNLYALVDEGYVSGKNFVCPKDRTDEMYTTTFFSDYVLTIPSIHTEQADGFVGSLLLMYELPCNHNQDIVNLLFKAGHVCEESDMEEFRKLVQTANDFLVSLVVSNMNKV